MSEFLQKKILPTQNQEHFLLPNVFQDSQSGSTISEMNFLFGLLLYVPSQKLPFSRNFSKKIILLTQNQEYTILSDILQDWQKV